MKIFFRELGNNVPRSKVSSGPDKAREDNSVASSSCTTRARRTAKAAAKLNTPKAKIADVNDLAEVESAGVACSEAGGDTNELSVAVKIESDQPRSNDNNDILEMAKNKIIEKGPCLDPNEIVYCGSVTYNPMYIFWQV